MRVIMLKTFRFTNYRALRNTLACELTWQLLFFAKRICEKSSILHFFSKRRERVRVQFCSHFLAAPTFNSSAKIEKRDQKMLSKRKSCTKMPLSNNWKRKPFPFSFLWWALPQRRPLQFSRWSWTSQRFAARCRRRATCRMDWAAFFYKKNMSHTFIRPSERLWVRAPEMTEKILLFLMSALFQTSKTINMHTLCSWFYQSLK